MSPWWCVGYFHRDGELWMIVNHHSGKGVLAPYSVPGKFQGAPCSYFNGSLSRAEWFGSLEEARAAAQGGGAR